MPQRIRRYRTKGWKLPTNARCVTRPGKYGNPFVVNAFTTRADAVAMYRRWLNEESAIASICHGKPPTKAEIVRDLRGKDLACFCPLGQPCHADVLLALANEGAQQ